MTERDFLIKLYKYYNNDFVQSAFFGTYVRVAAEVGVLGFSEPGISTKIKYRLKVCMKHKAPVNCDINQLRVLIFKDLCQQAINKINYWQRTGEWSFL